MVRELEIRRCNNSRTVMFMCTTDFDDFAWKWNHNTVVTPLKTVLNSSQANQSLLHFLVEMAQIR